MNVKRETLLGEKESYLSTLLRCGKSLKRFEFHAFDGQLCTHKLLSKEWFVKLATEFQT